MLATAAPPAATDLAAAVRARYGARIEAVRLYGSRARGDAHEDSDVDVLVLVRDLVWQDKIEIAGIASDVSLRTGFHVSATAMSPEELDRLLALELRFAENVVREGVAL